VGNGEVEDGRTNEEASPEVKIGDDVSFLTGSGWETQGHIGRVVYVASSGDVTVHCRRGGELEAQIVGANSYLRGALRYGERGRESPMDYASRISKAIATQNCRVRNFEGEKCPACEGQKDTHPHA